MCSEGASSLSRMIAYSSIVSFVRREELREGEVDRRRQKPLDRLRCSKQLLRRTTRSRRRSQRSSQFPLQTESNICVRSGPCWTPSTRSIYLRTPPPSHHPVYSAAESPNLSTLLRSSLRRSGEERMQDIVDEVLAQGGWITRTHRLRGQKLVKSRPSIHLKIRLTVTMTCSPKVCERAACGVMKALAKRK